jgi:hypothetical protein
MSCQGCTAIKVGVECELALLTPPNLNRNIRFLAWTTNMIKEEVATRHAWVDRGLDA